MQKIQGKTLAEQKVKAYVALAQKNQSLWNGVLVFLGALFLLTGIPFFPVFFAVVLAGICGIIAFKFPPGGVIFGIFLGFFAVIYQTSVLGWFYLLVIAAVLFSVNESWFLIATLEILIMAPFAVKGVPFIGWISILGMCMSALYFGAKRSLSISLPSITMILLLSSLWAVQNTAYLPINLGEYSQEAIVAITKSTTALFYIPNETMSAIGRFLSFENLGGVLTSIGIISNNIITLITNDSLIVQLLVWGLILYALGYLPARLKRWPQTTSSLVLLILIPAYYFIGIMYSVNIPIELYAGIIFTIIVLSSFEILGINLSRQSEVERKDKMKSYGKFGMADISLGGEEKSLDDIGGYEDVKKELKDSILLPIERKEIAYTYGIKPPSGILLFGPPGTGKTMLMRALAKELKYNFIEVKCSQILSQWYGESEKNLAEVFDNARKNAPTILFFDEIDSVAKKRSAEGIDEVTPRVLSTLLQEMDGATKTNATVMVIGATNVPDKLDSALMRPGRFDKVIYMHLPDPKAREEIFKVHLGELPLTDDVDLSVLVRKTERFSGADIKNIVMEAKRLAAKEATSKNKIVPITMAYFTNVLQNIKPSTSLAQLEIHEQFKTDFERRVGGAIAKKEDSENENQVKWTEVIGLDDVKDALLEAIEFPLLHEKEMKEFQVKSSKGILLFGPPGTGKTLIVRAASGELKASFQTLSVAELMKKGYTQAVSVIKETFNRARENTPALIFVDEIETFAPARGMGGGSEILGQFLTEMDGVKSLKGVVVIAATNKPGLMDSAIMRPGRFDKIFYIPPPDEAGREGMFRLYLGQFIEGVNLGALAVSTPGFSGADIASVCQSIKMTALRAKISGQDPKITTDLILKLIKIRRPSITPNMLEEYKKFMEDYGERR